MISMNAYKTSGRYPVRSIDRLVTFDSHSPRRDAGDEDDHKQAEGGKGRKEADEDGAASGEFH
jgi:hypothetical protein